MAYFPTSVISTANLVSPTSTQPTNNPSHTGAHVLLNGELIAIETFLTNNFKIINCPVNGFNVTTAGYLQITVASYTSNTAAIAGGLAATTIYRNGDNICIVH